MADYVAAVDVGTGSARAGIFDPRGRMLGRAEHPIDTNRPAPDQVEQDSEQIWAAVCAAVRAARATAGVDVKAVRGLAFDATCSLVVRGADGGPVTVSAGGDDRWDTLLWLDHRAVDEAAACSATGHPAAARDGGAVSPELQIPKLMWLKRHLPESWARADRIQDLTDFLAWKACGTEQRSLCPLACKWSYQAHRATPWPDDYFAALGLDDVIARASLPARAVPVGQGLGTLGGAAADRLGLTGSCRVAAGLIDAHAGALGSLGARAGDPLTSLALIAGTSNCVMAIGPEATTRRGVWGPHLGAILPGLWVSEAGQSASGALLDHVCRGWGCDAPTPEVHARIGARIETLLDREGWNLAGDLHVLPDFAGNRSPLADPSARGVISGLTLDASFDALCRLYWRSAVGIALGLRQIVTLMTGDAEARPDLFLSGGHARSPLLTRLYATATGCRVVVTPETDAMLLGTAMTAAAGAGLHRDLATAAAAMRPEGSTVAPDPNGTARMERDDVVFRAMQRQRRELADLDSDPAPRNTG